MKIEQMCLDEPVLKTIAIYCTDYPEGILCALDEDSDGIFTRKAFWNADAEDEEEQDDEEKEDDYDEGVWSMSFFDLIGHYGDIRFRLIQGSSLDSQLPPNSVLFLTQ